MELLIVTGLSGAGKSVAMHALEDIGYFCIDNIPAGLLSRLVDFAQQSEILLQKVAVGLDVRSARSSRELIQALGELDRQQAEFQVLFLDASDEVLQRRYKETRRRHPMSISEGLSTTEALARERQILRPLYEHANYILDTSLLSPAQNKQRICALFLNSRQHSMALTVLSFGFKYGTPKEADIIWDVRCLPNPYYVPELKEKTGLDQEVVDYVMASEASQQLLTKLQELLALTLPLYVKEGKSQLTIAIGCTGGKHRSITFARLLADYCEKLGYAPVVQHRDANRTS
ncbi:RNase adapter RapZ [Gemmiger formicilis]|uniref:RNase adapter RapZ n=1 Tax=Gemmiger formicilis TaxID=745368 RepID=UPI001957894C|nr:RNase adapter RapZ [Gemmiger formicilis]